MKKLYLMTVSNVTISMEGSTLTGINSMARFYGAVKPQINKSMI